MVSFAVKLEGRDPTKPRLRREEAVEMAALGFRFAEFDEQTERFRLSLPYKTAQNLERGVLTFMQG
jgi:hypothetical protein